MWWQAGNSGSLSCWCPALVKLRRQTGRVKRWVRFAFSSVYNLLLAARWNLAFPKIIPVCGGCVMLDFIAVDFWGNVTLKSYQELKKSALIPWTDPKKPLKCQGFGINQARNEGAFARLIPSSRSKEEFGMSSASNFPWSCFLNPRRIWRWMMVWRFNL